MGTLLAVGHVRLILLLACATALVALSAPAVAMAGTYSWNLPGDPGTFTGSNPEHKYNANSWMYAAGGTLSFSANADGSSDPGWLDAGGDYIADTGSTVALNASTGSSVTISWTNPLSESATVTNTFSSGGLPLLCTLSAPSSSVPPGGTTSLTLTNIAAVTGCTASGTLQIQAASPAALTLTSPSSNATFTTGEPEFSGAASTEIDASNTVSVNIYAGASASGTSIDTLTTNRSGGTYTVAPTAPLPNGEYTAQAVQEDPIGSPNTSNAVTFFLNNLGPGLTLNSLGSKPLLTSTPTFSGTAGVRAQDNPSVELAVYSGSSISGSPIALDNGTVGSDGKFSVKSSSLPDGRYTVLAGQLGDGLVGFSSPVTFRIKVHPPALSLSYPSPRELVSRSRVVFAGQAGDALGDSSTINVALYRGAKVRGPSLGTRRVNVNGSSWSVGWGQGVRNGTYTVRATQTDDAGHTTRITHVFRAVPGPTTIGGFVLLSSSGAASIPIGCAARSGTCSGTVLAVTTRRFRTTAGGPVGQLRVLFAFVQIPAGKTQTVRAAVSGSVAKVLHRDGGGTVKVTARLSRTGTVSAIRSLKLGL